METHLQRVEQPCGAHTGLNQLFLSPEIPWLPVSTGISWRNPKQAIPKEQAHTSNGDLKILLSNMQHKIRDE